MICTRSDIDKFINEMGLRKPKFSNGIAKITMTWDEHSSCCSKIGSGSIEVNKKISEMLPGANVSKGYGWTCYCRIEVKYDNKK